MALLVRNVTLYNREKTSDLLIEHGAIQAIEERIDRETDENYDATGLTAIPGVIDAHVHFRVPGGEAKEDWITGSRAALAGGVTTVLDMPNNTPAITTRELLKEKIERIKPDTLIDFGCYIGATTSNLSEILSAQDIACGVKVYYGTSTGNLTMNNADVLKALFQSSLKIPIVLHAEDDAAIAARTAQYKNYTGKDIHSKIRSREAAIIALRTIINAARGIAARLHITHLSTVEELELVRAAKREGMDITCDVTPHHLAFTVADYERFGTLLRVNPPIREQSDCDALWEGIRDGSVDMVATDHAPHLLHEKQQEYWSAPSGVPGVETLLPFLLHHVPERLSLSRLVELIAARPAERFGLQKKGVLEVGSIADITFLDLTKTTTITRDRIQSKCGWSLFEGRTFKGAVERVVKSGRLITPPFQPRPE